jgi:tRNA A37 threonylcarbamoyladenosine biosynthesis protein TsaE
VNDKKDAERYRKMAEILAGELPQIGIIMQLSGKAAAGKKYLDKALDQLIEEDRDLPQP